MTEQQKRQCIRCKHFSPPEDPKYNTIPEIGTGPDYYGQGYMDNSRCSAVTATATAPLIKGTEIPVLIREARASNSVCGPDGNLYEEEPVVSLLEIILNALGSACSSKT